MVTSIYATRWLICIITIIVIGVMLAIGASHFGILEIPSRWISLIPQTIAEHSITN